MVNIAKIRESDNRLFQRYETLRFEKGVSDKDVSDATGVAVSTLCEWRLNKTTPNVTNLTKLADYFKVSLDYLAGRMDFKGDA